LSPRTPRNNPQGVVDALLYDGLSCPIKSKADSPASLMHLIVFIEGIIYLQGND
jgi:hypothetical protein